MLTWMKAKNGNRWFGFDDDCPCYFVDRDEDGWYWEDSWGFGYGGFDTAEEAMNECEKDLPKVNPDSLGFTAEELEEIKGCREAHERMENAKGLF